MNHIGRWWQQRSALRSARAWLRHGNPDRIAAEAMWRLNRHARGGYDTLSVYTLKDNLMRLFCQRFPYTVRFDAQHDCCWSCGGTGNYYSAGDCYKCDGSGIFRSRYFYLFTFTICGRAYRWHVPAHLVKWPIPDAAHDKTTGPAPTFKTRPGETIEDPAYVDLLIAAIATYLEDSGIELHVFMGLADAFRFQWHDSVTRPWHNTVYRIRYRLRRRQHTPDYETDGDIPF